MKTKELADYIDMNTPFCIKDVDTDVVLWESHEDDTEDIPDMDLIYQGGITYDKKEKRLILWVDSEV